MAVAKLQPNSKKQPEQPLLQVTSIERSDLFNNRNFERYNPDALAAKKGGLRIYARMLEDEQVKAVADFKASSIIGRGWSFEFDEDVALTPEEQKYRINVMTTMLRKMRGSFTDSLRAIFRGNVYGFSLCEKVIDNFTYDGKDWIGVTAILPRDMRTFQFYTDEYGILRRFTQKVGGREIDLDYNRFIHYVRAPEEDPYYGESDLKAAYRSWFLKDTLVKFWTQYLERMAGGFAAIKLGDSGIVPGSPEYTALQSIVSNIRGTMGAILPRGVDLDLTTPGSTDAYQKGIEFHDLSIAKALLIPNLLGLSNSGGTGAYAQSQTHLEVYLMTIAADTQRLEQTLNDQLFREVASRNWDDDIVPRFRFNKASEDQVRWTVQTWAQLVGSSIALPTEEDESYLRKLMGMPHRDKQDPLLAPPQPEPMPGMELPPGSEVPPGEEGGPPQSNGEATGAQGGAPPPSGNAAMGRILSLDSIPEGVTVTVSRSGVVSFAEYNEEDHPRDENGRWTSKDGGGSSASPKSSIALREGKPREKQKVSDIAKEFTFDKPLSWNENDPDLSPAEREQARANFSNAVDAAAEEIAYQLKVDPGSKDWYSNDVAKAFEITAKHIPQLNDPAHRELFGVVAGIFSNGTNPMVAWMAAAQAYEKFAKSKSGKFPLMNPETKKGWTFRGGPNAIHLKMLNGLIDQYGVEGAVKWLSSEHSNLSLAYARKAYAGGQSGDFTFKTSGDKAPGYLVFGPKLGQFIGNLHGNDGATVDKWMTRNFHRYFGSLADKNSETGTKEDPATPTERAAIKRLITEAGARHGLRPQQAQALLWYYEQNLYTHMGVKSVPRGFSDAAGVYSQRRSAKGRRKNSREGFSMDANDMGEDNTDDMDEDDIEEMSDDDIIKMLMGDDSDTAQTIELSDEETAAALYNAAVMRMAAGIDSSFNPKLKFHGDHDQKTHGRWATGEDGFDPEGGNTLEDWQPRSVSARVGGYDPDDPFETPGPAGGRRLGRNAGDEFRDDPLSPWSSNLGVGPGGRLSYPALHNRIIQNGGFSYQPIMQRESSSGYMVSTHPQFEEVFKGQPTVDDVAGFIRRVAPLLAENTDLYAGAWYDPEADKVYFDVSTNVQDRDEAVKLAQQHNQEAIFDVTEKTSIYTKPQDKRRLSAQGGTARVSPGRNPGADRRSDQGGTRGREALKRLDLSYSAWAEHIDRETR